MTKIKLPERNIFYPKDTIKLIYQYVDGRFVEAEKFKSFNFFYLFNMPEIEIDKKSNSIRIKINKEIDRFKWDYKLFKLIERRLSIFFSALKNQGYNFCDLNLQLSFRMIVGLGASHPQETSMTLHYIYGIPYIPGSAIKGVARHWVVASMFNNEEKKAEKDLDFIKIFGTQGNEGKVIFFDAYPVNEVNLKIDIINPHYSRYYSGDEQPGDWLRPRPINFLTVENTRFHFFLASRDGGLLETSKEWLREALTKFGIGAKTSIGYGYFNET